MPAGILVADDHRLVRDGICTILASAPDLHVGAVAENGAQAVERALDPRIRLALLDVAMPELTGLQAARELVRRRPDLRVLMLSLHDGVRYRREAAAAGAHGYVLKTASSAELVAACRNALRGGCPVAPGSAAAADALTARELQVVRLIALGHTTSEVARLLVISPRTVERHRENVLAKLGARNLADVTRYAMRHGLVEP